MCLVVHRDPSDSSSSVHLSTDHDGLVARVHLDNSSLAGVGHLGVKNQPRI